MILFLLLKKANLRKEKGEHEIIYFLAVSLGRERERSSAEVLVDGNCEFELKMG